MASAQVAYSRGEDIWKVATELQQARNLRRMSQPAPLQNYRRDSITREPYQSYRRDSMTRDSVKDYRSGSITRDPISTYRRDSITRDSLNQDYRRASVTNGSFQSYRRDSVTKDPIANYMRDSLTRDAMIRQPPQQSNGTANGTTGRRGSDADDINWIAKYKRSDHHTDRLVNKKLEAMADERSNYLNGTAAFSSAIPSSHSNHESPPKPVHYEGTNRLTVFLQPAQGKPPRSYPTSHVTVQEQPRSRSQTLPSSSASPRLPLSSSRNDYRSPFTSDRFSRPSSIASSSLASSSIFGRRSSVDSSLFKTSRSSAFTPFTPTPSTHSDFRASPAISSQFSTDLTQSHPYRPSFTRAPSLPPTLQLQSRPSSSLPYAPTSLTTNGYSRSSVASDLSSRRFSLANISDLSKANYRRSVDLSALKSTTGGFKSSNLSTFGSDLLRRGSYETVSPLSPLSPLSPSCLPPPSERIFGSRGTHSTFRRNRRSLADG